MVRTWVMGLGGIGNLLNMLFIMLLAVRVPIVQVSWMFRGGWMCISPLLVRIIRARVQLLMTCRLCVLRSRSVSLLAGTAVPERVFRDMTRACVSLGLDGNSCRIRL